jgi:hypothetical protein
MYDTSTVEMIHKILASQDSEIKPTLFVASKSPNNLNVEHNKDRNQLYKHMG